ncbi:hypothetical protein FVEG_10757 [Fusarium verticillioides 7600]|uniref:Uncharacterized protein n=1 Tax=Gibberella moniliformis (strain M3125 / FGSC 7600) TaxID=334819 RepID=W7N5K2_GIBM7|nr:hypothetical protein FVEG_10757 [Fusarium verticillioides 7600]EWG51902.1 hypothetical protein FVEG_10757 [Fusarium verticillioides 7600]
MATAAQKSRLEFTLSTGDRTANNNTEYYDQVTALSQALINRSFRDLFENTKGIAGITHTGKEGDRIFGELDAPTIMLIGHVDDPNLAYYQLRIKSADVVFRNGQTRTLSQWVLNLKVNLGQVPGFIVGDYHVQRIFANFAASEWVAPMEGTSTCFDPKTKTTISLQEWKDRPENSDYFYRITGLIGEWAKTEAHKGLSTLGIKFSLPQEEDKPLLATFRPMLRHTQVYPYKSHRNPKEVTSIGDCSRGTQAEPYGDLVQGDFNCLTFCENIDTSWDIPGKSINPIVRSLPLGGKLSHPCNLAFPVSEDNLKAPDSLGTFAMDHRVVMDRYLLPTLEDLCRATVVKINDPERKIAAPEISFQPRYTIGSPPPERQLNSSPNGGIEFTKMSECHYRWRCGDSKEKKGHLYTDGPYSLLRDRYNSYKIDTESAVDVEWSPGQPTLAISASISYKYDCAFADREDMTGHWDSVKYEVNAAAAFSLGLHISNSTIIPKVKGISRADVAKIKDGSISSLDGLNTVSDGDLNVVSYPHNSTATGKCTDDSGSVFKKDLETSLRPTISEFMERINEHFNARGQLVLPGYGNLEMKNPRFSKLGGIVADFVLKSTAPDGTISFPEPHDDPTSGEKPSGQHNIPTGVTEPKDENTLKLNWDYQVSYNPATKIGRLSLHAKNNKKEELSFHFIRISLLTSASTRTRPFDDTEWSPSPDDGALDILYSNGEYVHATLNKHQSEESLSETTLKGNVYELSRGSGWPTNLPALEVAVKTDRSAGEMQASVQGSKSTGFRVPKDQELSLVLQGDIQELGRYKMKIAESWKKVPGLKFGGEGTAISYRDINI